MNSSQKETVGVAVITHNAKKHLKHCLPPLLNSPLKPKVLVVNSSSEDGTIELAKEMGAEVLVIPRKEFNHGTTREKARLFLNTDIIVMVTPDAYALDNDMLEKLVTPLKEGKASISYARQIPHKGSDFFESYAREFNYPSQSHIRSKDDTASHGIYTIFCSNSCAAYRNEALDEIGGFKPVLLGEDTFTTAKLLLRGHKIAYVAEAVVKHSHRYSLTQEFKRNFDIGLARKQQEKLITAFGRDQKRGKEYVTQMLKKLAKEKPWLIPYACLQILTKYAGYSLGKACINQPDSLKRIFSSQDFYW